ncbi:MAG TPA: biotin--[acetyl-CoA-carboxylase] ligase [Syntrophomonas sp.]|jgi:BirA family biotin operon repressor/biotin-[acetyl-CoA-carboxylase] ligase|nr:biotin--[acetyl-CoA-carboxylase] ligase [Syntrophomonas sp.]
MRQRILKELIENRDGFISGSQLAERLGISRVAIWKHIEALKEEGYDITGISGRGYQLKDSGIIIPDEIMAGLPQQLIGSQIYYYPRLDSTNEALKRSIKDYPLEGTVYVAGKQEGGKGRRGKKWESPPGGLWFSFLLRPTLPLPQTALLSLVFAVSLAKSLDVFLRPLCQIKWPNDIYCQGKKIAGILLEMSGEIDNADYLIAGIGINVNVRTNDLPAAIDANSTSLLEVSGREIDANEVLLTVLKDLDSYYREFLNNGFSDIRLEFKSRCLHLGKVIETTRRQQIIRGLNTDIDEMGNLMVQCKDDLVRISTGDVKVL